MFGGSLVHLAARGKLTQTAFLEALFDGRELLRDRFAEFALHVVIGLTALFDLLVEIGKLAGDRIPELALRGQIGGATLLDPPIDIVKLCRQRFCQGAARCLALLAALLDLSVQRFQTGAQAFGQGACRGFAAFDPARDLVLKRFAMLQQLAMQAPDFQRQQRDARSHGFQRFLALPVKAGEHGGGLAPAFGHAFAPRGDRFGPDFGKAMHQRVRLVVDGPQTAAPTLDRAFARTVESAEQALGLLTQSGQLVAQALKRIGLAAGNA